MQLIRTLIHNTSFTLISQLMVRASNTLLFVIVSRLLGVSPAGSYTLAFSYAMLATRLSFWGLDQLLIRETASDSSSLWRFFSNFFVVRGAIAIIAWFLLWLITSLLLPYDDYTDSIILIVGLVVVPENIINLCEAVFISRGRVRLTLYGRLVALIMRVMGGGTMLLLGYGMEHLAWLIAISSFVTMIVDLWLIFSLFWENEPWQFDYVFIRRQLQSAVPLMAGGWFYVLDNRLDVLIISFFLDEADVGIYNAAATVISTMLLIPHAYQVAVLPAMSRFYHRSMKNLKNLYIYSVKYLFLCSMLISIIIIYWGEDLLWLFGQDFHGSVPVLRILTWMLPVLFLNVPTARLLVASHNQRVIAQSLLIRLLFAALLSAIFVNSWEMQGVAGARLIASLIMTLFNISYVHLRIFALKDVAYILGQVSLATLNIFLARRVLHSLFPLDLVVGGIGYIFILGLTGFYSKEEKRVFYKMKQILHFR
jgi:O-antigen/teichoic acid export membrane protein